MSSKRLGKSQVSEYNDRKYEINDFENVYSSNFNQQYSISREPNIDYQEKVHYLAVSSKNRNVNFNSLVNNYTVYFPCEFKNIYSIELIQAIIPDKNNVINEPYLLLDIEEIQDVMVSSDSNISKSFAILLLDTPNIPGGFIQIDNRIHENTVLNFTTPKASLSKMSISIKNSDGNLFDFGLNSDTLNKNMQNTFIFKIITGEKKRDQLHQRNVY
jgi:hypothetical protein